MYRSSQAMNLSKPCYRSAKDRLKMMNLEKEIFLSSEDLVDMYMSEVNLHPLHKLREVDYDLLVVVRMIQNFIESLDEFENEDEVDFWKSQIVKLREDVECYKKIHLSWRKDRDHAERAKHEILNLATVAGLDWEEYKSMAKRVE